MGFLAADAVGYQGGGVAVASVFAEEGGCVPELGEGLFGDGEGAEAGEEHPALDWCAERGLCEEVGGAGDDGAVCQVAEDVAERFDAAALAGGEDGFGGGDVPDAGDAGGDLAWYEVVEQGVDDLGRYAAERR
ncbi:hypothetical protein [Kribbella sp. NPDC051718]|uniref:hypothetical protein n=1 Tax=Kribbella sp. NPDC051718 TaxID=3155168 RepID=UPI003439233A